MEKTVIAEGKTTNEAILNGLRQLNVSKDKVDIKVLESEDKRSFFSILAPRVVKVQLTLKEDVNKQEKQEKKEIKHKKDIVLTSEELEKSVQNVENFMKEFKKALPEGTKYSIEKDELGLKISINHNNLGYLIGYRGDTLYALQNILAAIASKNVENKVRVILDIEGYKEKREKTLEELAIKVAKTVVKTKRSLTLEPMQAYERKIIHSKLQNDRKVETTSIGEEPYRRIVVSLKNK